MASLNIEMSFPVVPTNGGDLETFWEELPNGCKLTASFSPKDGVWLAGNKEGLLLLSRLLTEIALRDLEDGFHHHALKLSNDRHLDFTIEKLSNDDGGQS